MSVTSGARFGTVTAKLCRAERPPPSVAVTVTSAVPDATPATVKTLPDTATLTRVVSDDAAPNSRSSPSGSEKCPATSTSDTPPTATSRSPISPTASGARFGTVTAKLCWAERPPPSVAVTVTSAAPDATPATVKTPPDTATDTIAMSELAAP